MWFFIDPRRPLDEGAAPKPAAAAEAAGVPA
jgi:hypothetical protein